MRVSALYFLFWLHSVLSGAVDGPKSFLQVRNEQHIFFFFSQFHGKQPNQEYSTAAVIFVEQGIFTKMEASRV